MIRTTGIINSPIGGMRDPNIYAINREAVQLIDPAVNQATAYQKTLLSYDPKMPIIKRMVDRSIEKNQVFKKKVKQTRKYLNGLISSGNYQNINPSSPTMMNPSNNSQPPPDSYGKRFDTDDKKKSEITPGVIRKIITDTMKKLQHDRENLKVVTSNTSSVPGPSASTLGSNRPSPNSIQTSGFPDGTVLTEGQRPTMQDSQTSPGPSMNTTGTQTSPGPSMNTTGTQTVPGPTTVDMATQTPRAREYNQQVEYMNNMYTALRVVYQELGLGLGAGSEIERYRNLTESLTNQLGELTREARFLGVINDELRLQGQNLETEYRDYIHRSENTIQALTNANHNMGNQISNYQNQMRILTEQLEWERANYQRRLNDVNFQRDQLARANTELQEDILYQEEELQETLLELNTTRQRMEMLERINERFATEYSNILRAARDFMDRVRNFFPPEYFTGRYGENPDLWVQNFLNDVRERGLENVWNYEWTQAITNTRRRPNLAIICPVYDNRVVDAPVSNEMEVDNYSFGGPNSNEISIDDPLSSLENDRDSTGSYTERNNVLNNQSSSRAPPQRRSGRERRSPPTNQPRVRNPKGAGYDLL